MLLIDRYCFEQWMCVKGEYVDGYEIYADFILPLTFRTRFCTTTAMSDAANIRGEYCVLAKENSVKDDQNYLRCNVRNLVIEF